MTTLDETRAALAAAEARLGQSAGLAGRSVGTLFDLLRRMQDEGPDALDDLSECEALAVRSAIILTCNLDHVIRLRHCVTQAIAETN